MIKTKITQEIEDTAWQHLEMGEWTKCQEYLKEKGFSEEEIELMLEYWKEGKSFAPYE